MNKRGGRANVTKEKWAGEEKAEKRGDKATHVLIVSH